MKPALFGKTLSELTELAIDLGLPKFTGRQLADWLYKKDVEAIADMSNLSKKARDLLGERYCFGLHAPEKVQTSTDGTKKYLFETATENFIETAMIPFNERRTVCVSSQVGCALVESLERGAR